MRISVIVCTAVAVTLTAGGAAAQGQTPPASAPQPAATATPASAPAETTVTTGTFDFGGRGTTFSGDSARYNQYRDMSNGLFLDNFQTDVQKSGWFLDFGGTHAGRADAFYSGEAVRPGRLKVWGQFQQMPWLISDTTKTLFQGAGTGVLTIPDYVQSLLQTSANNITSVTPNANPLTLSSQRKYSTGGFQFMPDRSTTVDVQVQHMDRSGVTVGGGSFGFSAADELPIPVNQHQTDVDANVERALGLWLFRVGYSASSFTNDTPSLTWDDPYQLTDKTSLSGTGSMALAPNDLSQTVHGLVSVKLPMRTRMTGTVSFGSLTDNTTILPETTNTTLTQYHLDRTTVNGDGRTTSGNFIFTSRPVRALDIDVRYRYYDYDNRTPIATQIDGRIEYDSTTELAPLSSPNMTVPYGVKHQTVDASANYDLGRANIGAGYSRDDATYTYRILEGSVENAARVTFDTTGVRWLVLHGRYEHSQRRGNGLDNADLVTIGEQPTLQTFDIADRDEDTGTVTGSVLLGSSVSINVSGGGGRDTYPVNAAATGFGLANALFKTYGAGVAATPTDNISLSLSYDLNIYTSLQDSRAANPGVQFTDPTRDWSATGNDRTHSVLGDVDVKNLFGKLRLHATVDFNKGSTLYLYGLAANTTLPAVSQLPAVMSELRRGTLDLTYPLTARVTVGIGYWYEQFIVADFAQDSQALPTLNIPSLLTLGNALLPYTAQTVWGHLIYRW